MKKIFILFAALAAMTCVACNPKETETEIQWNVEASIEGQGIINVSYPTGNFVADGTATIAVVTAKEDSVEVNAPNFKDVLVTPENYSEEEIALANQIQSAFNVDVLEGEWKAAIKGYAKYGTIYLIIDEEWPRTDECYNVEIVK